MEEKKVYCTGRTNVLYLLLSTQEMRQEEGKMKDWKMTKELGCETGGCEAGMGGAR